MLHAKNDMIKCLNFTGISLVVLAGKMLVKIIVRGPSDYREFIGILPNEQGGFVIRRPQQL